jgi:hypothetical protein
MKVVVTSRVIADHGTGAVLVLAWTTPSTRMLPDQIAFLSLLDETAARRTSVVAALAGEQIVKFCCTAWLHHSSAPCRLHKSLAHANLLTIASNNSTETKSNQMQTERRVVVATQVFLSFLGTGRIGEQNHD